MKRSEMILHLQLMLVEAPQDLEAAAEDILSRLEKWGMKPPCVNSDKCQALLTVYVDPSFNMWDEEFETDSALVAAYQRRLKCSKS